MWNPFSRRTPVGGEPEAGPVATAPASGGKLLQRHELAQVDAIGDVTVVTFIVDDLTFMRGAAALADLLDELAETGHRQLVLDLQNVGFMDSACIGCIVDGLNNIAREGGRIAVANPARGIAHIFRITRLDRVFPICSDVMAAVRTVERLKNAA